MSADSSAPPAYNNKTHSDGINKLLDEPTDAVPYLGTAVEHRPGVHYDINGRPVYSLQPDNAPHAQNSQGMNYNLQLQRLGPPTTRWRDGLFDCFSNLWPSCCCAYCCGIWIMGQIAQKSGFATFKKVVITYVVVVLIWLILSVARDVRAIAVLPPLMFIILNVLVRLHVARTHLITRPGPFCEACAAVCCTCCSTAQMARHMFGYRKILDGDSDPLRPDHYND